MGKNLKNNTMAMLATISLAVSVACLISYVDPVVCAGLPSGDSESCNLAAQQHLWGFAGFSLFGAVTLTLGFFRNRNKRL